MLYTINLDDNNYILSLSHTKNDNIEVDPESLELKYLNAYQLIEGMPVLNEERKAELIANEEQKQKEEQIAELIRQLEATNDDMLDFVEQLCSLNNPLTFINDLIALMKNYSALVLARQHIRQEIKELQK